MLSAEQPSQGLVAIRTRTRVSRGPTIRGGLDIGACIGVLLLVAGPLPYLLRFDHGHYITTLLLTLTLAACSFYSQRGAIAATMVLLAVLGDYRRYAGYFEGYSKSDPLLLIAPVIAVLLLGQALLRGRKAPRTFVSWLTLALMILMVIEMFNPEQGGLQIGFAGALFYLGPLLWFWVARSFASLELTRQFTWVVIGLGVAATLLGLYQTYFGLLPFEQQWVEQIGYQSLYISDDVVRAVGFFNSSAEYQRYLLVVAVTIFALWSTTRSPLVVLLPLFLVSIFLSAARGPVVMVLMAMVVVWAISARSVVAWLPRLAVAAVMGAGAMIALLLHLQSSSLGGRVAPLVERQVGGLLDPANQEKSTATGHLQMIEEGLIAGVVMPAGSGLGATTEAAQKYGARNHSAEVDFANLMISLGLVGGLLYLVIVTTVLLRGLTWWRIERHPYALVVLGSLVATLGGWLIGGEYSVAALIWFQIGLMDRLSRDAELARRRSRAHAPGTDHA
ncbi:MAG: hypothetical protein ACLPTM_12245 [Steroidobacteraceae bacterium]